MVNILKAMKNRRKHIINNSVVVLILTYAAGGKTDKAAEKTFLYKPVEYPSQKIVHGFMMNETFSQKDCADSKACGANVIRI